MKLNNCSKSLKQYKNRTFGLLKFLNKVEIKNNNILFLVNELYNEIINVDNFLDYYYEKNY